MDMEHRQNACLMVRIPMHPFKLKDGGNQVIHMINVVSVIFQ